MLTTILRITVSSSPSIPLAPAFLSRTPFVSNLIPSPSPSYPYRATHSATDIMPVLNLLYVLSALNSMHFLTVDVRPTLLQNKPLLVLLWCFHLVSLPQ